ncbi:MAG: amino acid permease [Campylobacteraceae bacterium]|nr:amino acid permease [Campylobacteraceae bacterium]
MKLNAFSLSGLIIGPILGSGIILLPPLLYNSIKLNALLVLGIILFLGFIFALIFGKLAILYKGEGGVTLATKAALGKKYQLLSSFYLICAVFFGPVAVLLIAAQFIQEYFSSLSLVVLALLIYVLTYVLLLVRIDFLGKLMLVISTFISLLFIVSSIYVLFNSSSFVFVFPSLSFQEFGHSFVLAFWAIVGWEVIGNYSNDIKNNDSLKYAVIASALIVSLVYILVIFAICFGDFPNKTSGDFSLYYLLEPLFKEAAYPLLSWVSLLLCIGTLILFVGGVARLIASLELNKYTSKYSAKNTPIGALNSLSFVYIITLVLVYFEYLNLTNLVSFADGFFIANAIIGLITAIVLFEKGFLQYAAMFLVLVFTSILLFSNIFILLLILFLFVFTFFKKNTLKKSA